MRKNSTTGNELRRDETRRESLTESEAEPEVYPRVAEERGIKKIRKRSLMSDQQHQEIMSRGEGV